MRNESQKSLYLASKQDLDNIKLLAERRKQLKTSIFAGRLSYKGKPFTETEIQLLRQLDISVNPKHPRVGGLVHRYTNNQPPNITLIYIEMSNRASDLVNGVSNKSELCYRYFNLLDNPSIKQDPKSYIEIIYDLGFLFLTEEFLPEELLRCVINDVILVREFGWYLQFKYQVHKTGAMYAIP